MISSQRIMIGSSKNQCCICPVCFPSMNTIIDQQSSRSHALCGPFKNTPPGGGHKSSQDLHRSQVSGRHPRVLHSKRMLQFGKTYVFASSGQYLDCPSQKIQKSAIQWRHIRNTLGCTIWMMSTGPSYTAVY